MYLSNVLPEDPNEIKTCVICLKQFPFFNVTTDEFCKFLNFEKFISLNTMPSFLNAARFKDVCNISNVVSLDSVTMPSLYLSVDDFNNLMEFQFNKGMMFNSKLSWYILKN